MKRMTAVAVLLIGLAPYATAAEPTISAGANAAAATERFPGEPNLKAEMWPASKGTAVKCTPVELQAKVEALKPGEILLVAPGAADAIITVKASGTKNAPITIRAAKRHNSKVKGFKLAGDYIIVDGFEITNPDEKAVGVNAGQKHLQTARIGCQMLNNYIHDIHTTAINAGEGSLVKGNLMRRVGRGVLVSDNSLIEGNEVDTLTKQRHMKNGKEKVKKTQYAFFDGNNIVFRGNYLHSAPKEWIKKGMGVCFFTTWDAWKFSPSSNILVEDNICFNATHASEPTAATEKKSDTYIFRNNLFGDTCYVGVLPMYFTNIKVVNNTFINCGAYPIWFQTPLQTKGAVVKNNVIAYVNRAPDVETYGWKPAESGIRNNAQDTHPITTENNMFDGCMDRGYGSTDFTAKAVFMDPAKKDFRLKPSSPGYDRNVGISKDLVAKPIKCDAPDAR